MVHFSVIDGNFKDVKNRAFSIKDSIKTPEKLRNFSTARFSRLNNKQKHFGSLFQTFELMLM